MIRSRAQIYNVISVFLFIFSLTGISYKDDEVGDPKVPKFLENPINFQASPQDGLIALSWENSISTDVIGAFLMRNTPQSESPSNGVEVLRGEAVEYGDSELENGSRYYSVPYVYDNLGRYSDVVFADAIQIENMTPGEPLVIYMSPNGTDSNDGLTVNTPLLSLSRVQQRLIELKPVIDCDIEVRIRFMSDLSFDNQTVDWTHTSSEYTISFMPLDYNYGDDIDDISGRPVFDGNGVDDWLFDLRARGDKTNVRFFYIKIQEYIPGGIRFYGNRNNLEEWNGFNTVFGCYFYEIGNKKYPDGNLGFGAIDFVNSDNNSIRNNHFIKAENITEEASHMHGVYLAHNSNSNVIELNKFFKISGDPVRIRDFSNNNLILNNDIEESGKYAYYSTYRNAENGECRSWENEFRDNTVDCGYSGEEIQLFRYFVRWNGHGALDDGDEYPAGDCQDFSNWLYTSGNDRVCM